MQNKPTRYAAEVDKLRLDTRGLEQHLRDEMRAKQDALKPLDELETGSGRA